MYWLWLVVRIREAAVYLELNHLPFLPKLVARYIEKITYDLQTKIIVIMS
jgi:hypothetical protein